MKVWEKIMLYPIGLCYWIADSAKKTGNFIGRKAKPAIAMLVAVTMLLSVMPLTSITAFAEGTDTGKAIQLVNSGTAANIGGGQADSIYFGTYKQSSDGNSGYNVDPIKWRVLSNADGKLFLLSDQNLDVFEYHKEKESVTWETSTMRSWLNGLAANQGNGDDAIDYTSNNFLDTAFSAKEQAAIADTTVVNDDNGSVDGGNDTTDKVFLLSIAEAENTSYFADDNSRIATNTAYVAGGGEIGTIGMNSVGEADYWWLRSPGCHDYCAARVNSGGVYSYGFVDKDIHAVRPAFNLNLNSVLFTSAADNSGHISRFGTTLPDYSGSEWKLTLKDGNDFSNGAFVESGSTTLTEGYAAEELIIGHASLDSFGAGYTNVTAMLTDADGNVLYYGSLTDTTVQRKSQVIIPAGLEAGEYTLSLYGEDWNEANYTDYATGTPFTTTITVAAPHMHAICGDSDCSDSAHTANDSWTAWDGTTAFPGGNVYLSDEVILSAPISVTGTVSLCLNGHGINAAGGYFDVASNGTLNLCSCKDDGIIKRTSTTEALISADNGATVNLYNVTLDGGAVWGGTTDATLLRGTANSGIVSSSPLIDAGYQRTAGGHITLNSGVVLQNNECSDAGDGGAITLGEDGTLVINGATICNNAKTDGNAGAIKAYAGAEITLNSGEIYGNSAYKHGGAIQIFGGDSTDYADAVLTMNGGTIRNNKAAGVGGGIAVSNYSQFIMNGGSIIDNATTDSQKRGGGVGFADADTAMSVSGNAVISGNAANNLYIGTNSCNILTVGAMGSAADIGVTMKNSSGGVFTDGGAAYVERFYSDDSDFSVTVDGENLKLSHIHSYTYTANNNVITETCTCGHSATASINASSASYTGSAITTASVTYSDDWAGSKDAVVHYENNTNVGTATAKTTIEGQVISITFQITAADISGATIILSPTSGTYNGTAYNPSVSVTLDGFGTLVEGTDYTLSWNKTGFTNADTYTVTVTGKGNFEGTTERTFTINAANLADVKVEQVGTLTYTGEALTPAVSANAVAVNNQPITFTYSTESEGPYSTEIPSFTNVGWAHTVYYRATADNHNTYYGSFLVEIEKATVTEPTIASKPYTGSVQTADVPASDRYTVTENNGGVNAGKYNVVLTLNDSANYQWATPENSSVTLEFEITKATNEWVTEPSINDWVYGETKQWPTSRAKFGSSMLTFDGTANDGSAYHDQVPPTKAGNYTVTVTVLGTDNYDKLEKTLAFTVKKAGQLDVPDLSYSDETISGKNDGRITHTTTDMEYRKDGETTYIAVTGDSIENLAPGTYRVRYKGDANTNPSVEVKVEIKAGRKLTITVPQNTVGYLVATSTTKVDWHGRVVITLVVHDGYSKTENFKFYINGNDRTDKLIDGSVYELNGLITDITVTVEGIADITPPAAEIKVADNGWTQFLNDITFGLFFKETQDVTITATDAGSGVKSIEYYIASNEMDLDAVKAITAWERYDGTFKINPDHAYVIYAKVTDNDGNVQYISSDGIVLDATVPVISGVENGKTYYTTQKVTVTEKNVASITLNGETAGNEITLEGNKNATYTIVVTDKAGNSTTVTVTMKPISDLSAPIDTLNKDNVNSGNEQVVDEVKAAVAAVDTANATEQEKAALKEITDKAAELEKVIDDTQKEITRITEALAAYDPDYVNSNDAPYLEQLGKDIKALTDGGNLTDAEEKALEDAKAKAEGLLDAIEDAAEATTSENTEKVKDVTAENVTPENKTDLEKAKEDLEKALVDNGGNYTDDEKKAIEDEIKRIDDALEVIENAEEVEELIGKLPENITKNDEDAIKAADDAYNALTDYEKSLVDADAKKALDDAKAALAELNKPADTDSPQTGDNSNIFLWIALLFISGGAVITLTVVDRKKRMASKR